VVIAEHFQCPPQANTNNTEVQSSSNLGSSPGKKKSFVSFGKNIYWSAQRIQKLRNDANLTKKVYSNKKNNSWWNTLQFIYSVFM